MTDLFGWFVWVEDWFFSGRPGAFASGLFAFICVMGYYLNSYRPLIQTWFGQRAVQQHGLPRFIDASCRREPDFENPFPSMTSICRGNLGAVRLQKGDYVAYMTVKNNYLPLAENGRYVVGGFRVIERFGNHPEAAEWYRAKGITLPSNCFVDDNEPMPHHLTGGHNKGVGTKAHHEQHMAHFGAKAALAYANQLRDWDEKYRQRVGTNSTFVVTEAMEVNLIDPPLLTDGLATGIFGGPVPNTRSLRRIEPEQFDGLMNLLKSA